MERLKFHETLNGKYEMINARDDKNENEKGREKREMMMKEREKTFIGHENDEALQ